MHRSEHIERNPTRRVALRMAFLAGTAAVLAACADRGGGRERNDTSEGQPEKYPIHKDITATIFWIGEPADESNDHISNVPTAWDTHADRRFGGFDGPAHPNGSILDVPRNEHGIITSFKPDHNPYYFALPAAEFTGGPPLAQARASSPWANETVSEGESLFKGRWAKIASEDQTIYAQWLDVGPNETDDYPYVFGDGSQLPTNTYGLGAGIDLSPAAAISLGFNDGGHKVSWQFVDEVDVPDGPWRQHEAIDNKTYWSK